MHRQPLDGHCSVPLASARVVACLAFLAGGVLSLEGHAQMQPFTPQEKAEIVAKLLRGPEMKALAAEAPEKIRVLSVVSAEAEEVKQRTENQVVRRLAEVVLIQYQTGAAFRVRVDVESGKALSVDPLRGRPQSSQEEREEARALIRRSLSLPKHYLRHANPQGPIVIDLGKPQVFKR